MTIRLFDFEAVMDEPVNGAGGHTAEPAPEPEQPEVEAAAETDQPAEQAAEEQPAAAWEDPAFLDAVDQRAAEMVRAQIEQLVQQQPAAEAEQPDWNERLNPLDDNYGENLAAFIRQELQTALAPVTERTQAETEAKADADVATMISEAIDRSGGFPDEVADEAKALIKMIAPTFGEEMVRRYGPTDRAAEAILQKATETVKTLLVKAGKTGGQARVDELQAVRDAHTTLRGGTGGVSVAPKAMSPRELFNQTFGLRPQ